MRFSAMPGREPLDKGRQLGGRFYPPSLRLPHADPHVERTVSLKTEAAIRLIELRRADPEVKKNPVATVRRYAFRQFRKIRSPDFKAAGEARFIQAPRGCFHGRAIAIEAK